MGLYLRYELCNKMGLKLTASSTTRKGSTFSITFNQSFIGFIVEAPTVHLFEDRFLTGKVRWTKALESPMWIKCLSRLIAVPRHPAIHVFTLSFARPALLTSFDPRCKPCSAKEHTGAQFQASHRWPLGLLITCIELQVASQFRSSLNKIEIRGQQARVISFSVFCRASQWLTCQIIRGVWVKSVYKCLYAEFAVCAKSAVKWSNWNVTSSTEARTKNEPRLCA